MSRRDLDEWRPEAQALNLRNHKFSENVSMTSHRVK